MLINGEGLKQLYIVINLRRQQITMMEDVMIKGPSVATIVFGKVESFVGFHHHRHGVIFEGQ